MLILFQNYFSSIKAELLELIGTGKVSFQNYFSSIKAIWIKFIYASKTEFQNYFSSIKAIPYAGDPTPFRYFKTTLVQ